LRADDVEKFWDETKFPDGTAFSDYAHAETKAPILKAQHPEFAMWSQGLHARSGGACSDCHMPYMRDGATKVSDHWVRSPLLNVSRSCQVCHHFPEDELKARVDAIQSRNHELLERAGAALMDQLDAMVQAAKDGASDDQLAPARNLQRKAQWRIDFIGAENSVRLHRARELDGLPCPARSRARAGRGRRLRTAGPDLRVEMAHGRQVTT